MWPPAHQHCRLPQRYVSVGVLVSRVSTARSCITPRNLVVWTTLLPLAPQDVTKRMGRRHGTCRGRTHGDFLTPYAVSPVVQGRSRLVEATSRTKEMTMSNVDFVKGVYAGIGAALRSLSPMAPLQRSPI